MSLTFNAFPKPDPSDNGLNNASILTFTGNRVNALIKEMTQNSIDAIKEGEVKVKVRIRRFDIKKQDFPNWQSLSNIFDQLIEYWRGQGQTNFTNYFRAAKSYLEREHISVFAFEDFNTKGLRGNTTKGDFKRLLLDEGVQGDKPVQGSLGGFGIGKNAFFALTPMQTVFYTSKNDEGIKFMGVTKMAEYKDESGKRKSNRIYYGDWNVEHPSEAEDLDFVGKYEQIPEPFRRTEFGLSSFAIGVKSESGWKKPVVQALVRNYWYRFLKDGLEAEIIDDNGEVEIINKDNFEAVSKAVFSEETDKSVLAYITAFINPQEDGVFEKEIKIKDFGKIKIHLIEQPDDSYEFPDSVLYIRDGMMIMQEAKGVGGLPKKIAGVIFSESVSANNILSLMEPPAHDKFDSTLLYDRSGGKFDQKDGKEILAEIAKAKKDAIGRLREKYTISSSSSQLVDEILSGFSDFSASGIGIGNTSPSDVEQFYKRKSQKDKSPERKKLTEVYVVSNQDERSGLVEGIDGGSGGGLPGPGSREGKSGIGPGVGEGAGGRGSLGGEGGSRKKVKRKDAEITVTFFFDREESGRNHYIMVVRTDKDLNNTHVSFTQFGDDGGNSAPTTKLESITDSVGNSCSFNLENSVYTVKDVELKSGEQNIFRFSFKETNKSAFKFINR